MAPLPCRVFLEKHYANGGLSKEGWEALKRVIRMIGAMEWETRVMYAGKIGFGVSKNLIDDHIGHILRIAGVFNRNMKKTLVIAEAAKNMLPDLKDTTVDELDDALTTWNNKLRILHVSNGNDHKLFKLIFLHYEAALHRRLECMHNCDSKYELGYLVQRSAESRDALKELYRIPATADRIVLDMRAAYQEGSQRLKSLLSETEEKSPKGETSSAMSSSPKRPPPPIPQVARTPLRRRPTFVGRETEVRERMIRGQVFSCRRPSTRGRAVTTDSSPGVEAPSHQRAPGTHPRPHPSPKESDFDAYRKRTA